MIRPAHRADRGFTLVEIMVVVVILGLLATLVAPNVLGSGEEAKRNKAQADCVTIAGAVELYFLKNGRLPENIDELTRKDERGNSFLKRYSKDPWSNDYEIQPGENPQDFLVLRGGPDKTTGTDDDITNMPAKDER
jgi:general secretion pathway protein G